MTHTVETHIHESDPPIVADLDLPRPVAGIHSLEADGCRFILNDDLQNPEFCPNKIMKGSKFGFWYCEKHMAVVCRPRP